MKPSLHQLWRRGAWKLLLATAALGVGALGCGADSSGGSDTGSLIPLGDASDAAYSGTDADVPHDGAKEPMLCHLGIASRAEARIDDFEDGDALIIPVDRRNGRWRVKNDGTGEQEPAAGMEIVPLAVTAADAGLIDGGVTYALYTAGSGFTEWGAAVSFDFHTNGGVPCLYDASYYEGIGFSAKGVGKLRFEISVPATVPVSEGGLCTGEGCGNRHGFEIELTPEWQRYRIGFLQLAQEPGFGQPASFDVTSLLSVFFRAVADQSFEFWIDDVGFFPDPRLLDAGVGGDVGDAAPIDASVDAKAR